MREHAVLVEKRAQTLFLRMAGDFVLGRARDYEDCSPLLDQLLYLAEIHSLAPVVYHMLKGQREALVMHCPEQWKRMQRLYHSAVYASIAQETSMMEMQNVFSQAGIPLVFFKGAQLRQLYPVPELRTMGDLDCLIRREDREMAHILMEQLEFQCEIHREPVWVYRRGVVVIEMHTQIGENSMGNGFDYQGYFAHAMERCEEIQGQVVLEREYLLVYLIYHIAKHLSSTGAGVRMIADIGAFLHNYRNQLDWEQVENMLRQSQLWGTALAVYGLCQRWFGVEPPVFVSVSKQVLDELEAYIVAGGTFGFETHDAGDMYRRRAIQDKEGLNGWKFQIHMMFHYLFPSSDVLVRYFLPAKRHRWLLPVAWGCRCWGGLFKRKRRSLATIHSMTQGDAQRSRREVELLREIGL